MTGGKKVGKTTPKAGSSKGADPKTSKSPAATKKLASPKKEPVGRGKKTINDEMDIDKPCDNDPSANRRLPWGSDDDAASDKPTSRPSSATSTPKKTPAKKEAVVKEEAKSVPAKRKEPDDAEPEDGEKKKKFKYALLIFASLLAEH